MFMKIRYTLIGLLSISVNASPINFNRLADSINRSENSRKYPYGIKSINVHGSISLARKVCLNTIRHQYANWLKTNQQIDFIQFLGNVYCPPKLNVMNKNWSRNVKYYYGK